MKVYKQRKGIVFTETCGQYLLAASKEAREYCPYVMQINETAAFFWKYLTEGVTARQLQEALVNEYEILEEGQVEDEIRVFLEQLTQKGYLLQSDS